ncbi:MAG: hypothetical protein AAF756_16990 [Pseudomonadota bacterium]
MNADNHTSGDRSCIDWKVPLLRSGFAGLLDRAFGPGYTSAELALQLTLPLAAAGAVPLLVHITGLPWNMPQQLVVAFLALDGLGGVITNSTSSAKRWFHRDSQTPIHHLAFAGMHVLHFALVMWVFAAADFGWFLGASAYLVVAAVTVVLAPLYLQRPLSAGIVAIGIGYSLLALPQIDGLEWLLPVFYMKIIGAHLLREEPYRPSQSSPAAQSAAGPNRVSG